MLQCQVALLSRVAGCTSSPSYLGGRGRRPAYAQEVQANLNNTARSLSQKQHKPELCPCHFTLVQTEQVCPSELKSHHNVRIPMWKADSLQEKVGQEWLAIQNTTLSEAGRLHLSSTKKMLNTCLKAIDKCSLSLSPFPIVVFTHQVLHCEVLFSPQEYFAGKKHRFALFTRRGDFQGQQKQSGVVKTHDQA